MSDFRAYCPTTTSSEGRLNLTAAESHHLISVNRARQGDAVIAFDGNGTEWVCRVEVADRKGAQLVVVRQHQAPPLPCALTLIQAIPKGAVIEDIVRQATEIGARGVQPILTSRTQVHFDADREARKVEKWRTTAIEAAKQCGNPWVPEIAFPQPLEDVLPRLSAFDLCFVASLHPARQPLHTALRTARPDPHHAPPARVAWLIGPEGDFSTEEMALIHAAGALPVSLGPLVLRCDTAAAYALSATACAFFA